MDEYVFFRLLRTGYSDHCTVFAAWRRYDGFPSKVRASIRQFKDYGGRIVRGPAAKNEPLIKTALLMRNIRLEELKQHGCVSGMVSERIYTHDCLKFYALFEDNVWDIVTDFLDTTGETLGQFIDGLRPEITDIDTLKTVLSWFAVEETAARILERFSETAHD